MAWTKVNFGKHSGKTLPQIAFADPDYLYWAIGDKLFAKGPLAAEAKDVARKAQRIRIQGCDPGEKKVRYYTHNPSGKLGNVEVVEADRGPHHGSSATNDRDFFDLFYASKLASYDKTGGSFVVSAVKYNVLGASDYRMTKARAEAFFDNASNFG
ncbi:MAG TPA: hypothetical protein VEZ20_05710 [Allosphingosinicella sp.]|nr:hypothetical protein [Allosphingosinicella sp.]